MGKRTGAKRRSTAKARVNSSTGRTSLADARPDLAAEWHPTKNGSLTPADVSARVATRVWWRCGKNAAHEWQTSIANRNQGGNGCPVCSGRVATLETSLRTLRPDLADEWHPTKNGELTPELVKPGSGKKVWWKCQAKGHEWQADVIGRRDGRGCPVCGGKRASIDNSLRSLRPDLAAEWHPKRNASLSPDAVTTGSSKKVWWQCQKNPRHEWQAVIVSRHKRTGACPFCAGHRAGEETSLRAIQPELAAEWHGEKNAPLTPDDVTSGSSRKVWWLCRVAGHEWESQINARARGNGCPVCAGRVATEDSSLRAVHPDLAEEWHPTKNAPLTPDSVKPGSNRRVWWRCRRNPEHEWEAIVEKRRHGGGACPRCASLAVQHPDLAEEWHPTKNGDLTPGQVQPGSDKKVWWRCRIDTSHEWCAGIQPRTSRGIGCPLCRKRGRPETSIVALFPKVAAEWNYEKNGDKIPAHYQRGSNEKVWWRCSANPNHVWEAVINSRTGANATGCPFCNKGWTIEAVRLFVGSLLDHLSALTPAELYVLFQQNGLLATTGRAKAFLTSLATGRFPHEELEKFTAGKASLVDALVDDQSLTLEAVESAMATATALDAASVDSVVHEAGVEDDTTLPVVETKDALAAVEHAVTSTADAEAVEFLVASGIAKLWKHAFLDEQAAVTQAEAFDGNEYSTRVKTTFLDEHRRASALRTPKGYTFKVDGRATKPNLMQRLVAVRVRDQKRVGNWSGTGAGKTLSAVLASRVVDAALTIVCCPNSVIEGWAKVICDVFPDSVVETKTFEPRSPSFRRGAHRYLVLNYEAFQQPDSAERVRELVESEQIDLVIVDEIHYAKQRTVEDVSKRRQLVTALVTLAGEKNPDLRVLGMSATPVINNLQEGRSMVELVTGVEHDDLVTWPSVPNCMRLHQRLATLGIRWVPRYDLGYEQLEVPVDCKAHLDEVRALGPKGSPLALEQILTRARLPVIREHVRRKTLIYTHYIQGIDRLLREALQEDGWRVGFFTGDDKTGLDGFLNGDVDVLIGTAAIGTGVDGLQRVCDRLIVNVLPWTAAEFEQLKGRIFRQGHKHEGKSGEKVTLVIPVTYADVNGTRWSWCESKLERLRYKKSIADAAVDGVVPEGHIPSPAQSYQNLMAWLARLDSGKVEVIERRRIVVPLPETDPADVEKRLRRYGDFSKLNRAWNQARSDTTHARLAENPEEWEHYHTLYREARKTWPVVPFEELIRWCRQRSGKVIGDFGCGEAEVARQLQDLHTVHSFDHIAANEDVVACDLAGVPLEDETLDVALFSLSLMGANCADYVREAHRTLKLDGWLHVVEATSRFTDRNRFAKDLERLGFGNVKVADMSERFTHLSAIKTEAAWRVDVELRF